ncbi:MAG TPA: FAD-dependent oxidoreductase, partial [Actinomycetota bacterium]|nr:FAD-dependent oxidoreductase [Actinomycetota bacterium]
MTATEPPTIAVIGGGITGLAAAWTLSRRSSCDVRVVLLEAENRLGGKIRTDPFEDGYVEAGPDAFLAREPWATELCHELGLENDLVQPSVFGGALWLDGRLRRIPPGLLFGVPTSPSAALSAPLSFGARMRALGDLVLPGPLTGP